MKIGIFSDLHYCSQESLGLGREPRRGFERLKKMLLLFAENGVDACVCLGDMIDHAQGDTKAQALEYLAECVSQFKALSLPIYLVPGNHDFLDLSREDFKNAGVSLAPFVLDGEQTRLVALDANYRSDMRHFDISGEKWDDANVPPEQLRLLDDALSSSSMPCVVLIHENLDMCVDFAHQVRNATEVNDIISRHADRIRAVIQGHFHYGADNTHFGIPYHTVKSICVFDADFYEIIEI